MLDRYNYDYEWDAHYCYPETHILKNKLNIHDPDALCTAEREITALKILYLKTNPVKGKLDFKHLKSIHRNIFSDIYSWAGKVRTVDISKGNVFCLARYVEMYAENLFNNLHDENYLIDTPKNDIPHRLSYYLSEINVMHPFREGNGRSQRLFIEYLAAVCGYHVDFSTVSNHEMIEASALTFAKEYDMLDLLFKRIITPISKEEQEKFISFFFGSRSQQMKLFMKL